MEYPTLEQTCNNCGNIFRGRYCNACGQKVHEPKHDNSVKYLLEEYLHFLTHFEGSFFTTVKTIFMRPGKLSDDYCNGIRKKYYKPTSLYLLIIIAYLVFPFSFSGLNMPLASYENMLPGYTRKVIEQKLEAKQINIEELSEHFAEKSKHYAEFVLLLVLPICTFVLMLLYFGKRPLFDNFIMSIEVNSFFILAFFVLLPVVLIPISLVPSIREIANSEQTLTIFYAIILVSFCTIAFKRFYKSPVVSSLTKTILFTFAHAFIVVVIYKITLFTIVMWMV